MHVYEGRGHSGDLTLEADVVVIGSGAGGSVVTRTLAEAGLDVIVLEEGAYISHEKYRQFTPTQVLRRMGREGGTTVAIPIGDTPAISILAGRTVGGSSTMTGGICFRIPDVVLDEWVNRLGLGEMTKEKLAPAFEAVEEAMHVTEVPEAMRSAPTNLFVEGAKRLGIPFKPLRRNTKDCRGASFCNFGCPYDAKMSVDISYLPKAVKAGARIYSNIRIDRVIATAGRASGVEGVILGENERVTGRVRVKAKAVCVSAGTLHTPMILRRSGIGRFGSQRLGRGITLHPSFRAAAMFKDRVDGWKGALQSVYSDHFEHEGITLMNAFPPVNVLAAAIPGLGPEYMKKASQMGHLSTFGGIVHDEGAGHLWPSPTREPLLTYRMLKRDKERFLRGMGIVAGAFFEAGAHEVYLPIFGAPPARSVEEVKKLIESNPPARRIESVTYHPLGSARMGTDPKLSVVKQTGESHDLPGLWVADGSIVPTSLGVNSQLPIMGLAQVVAWQLREALRAS